MKKYVSLFLIFSHATILFCQKTEFGIGAGFGGYFFKHQDKKRFENDLLQPTGRMSGGVLGYANFFSNYRFQMRTSVHLTFKPITFASTFRDASGTRIRNAMTFEFFASDFSLLGLYKINLRNSQILPFLGMYYSINKFSDLSFSIRKTTALFSNSSQNVSTGNNFSPGVSIVNESSSNYLGINAGCFWRLDRSRFELFLMGYLTPLNFFAENFTYKNINQINYLQGKYNYFIVGTNFKLSKSK